MLLGTELGFGPGDIVLGGDPALAHGKGHSIPYFSAHVCCGQTPGWIRIPLGTEVGLVAGNCIVRAGVQPTLDPYAEALWRYCVRWEPSCHPHRKWHSCPVSSFPRFSVHFHCGTWSPISATAVLLFSFVRFD